MKFILASMMALAALASTENINDHILEATATQTTVEQDHFWALTDMFVGAAFGAYVPLNMYARDGDCYSKFFSSGLQAVKYSKYATGTELKTAKKAILGFNILQDVLGF